MGIITSKKPPIWRHVSWQHSSAEKMEASKPESSLGTSAMMFSKGDSMPVAYKAGQSLPCRSRIVTEVRAGSVALKLGNQGRVRSSTVVVTAQDHGWSGAVQPADIQLPVNLATLPYCNTACQFQTTLCSTCMQL